jgi:hypothetical protein
MRVSIAEVRTALTETLKLINGAGQYTTSLATAKFPKKFSLVATRDADYPKVYILTNEGTHRLEPGRSQWKEVSFLIVLVDKAIGDEDDVASRLENRIDDVITCLTLNDDLGGKVQEALIGDWTTDAGTVHPEAVALIRVDTKYRSTY